MPKSAKEIKAARKAAKKAAPKKPVKLAKPRKTGEKPKRKFHGTKPLPAFSDPQIPKGMTKLAQFVISCEGEIPVNEAIREYQQEWCDHPKSEQLLISTIARPIEGQFEYTVSCLECGRNKIYQGRPPSTITRKVRLG